LRPEDVLTPEMRLTVTLRRICTDHFISVLLHQSLFVVITVVHVRLQRAEVTELIKESEGYFFKVINTEASNQQNE
jgi:hypothetical protein